MSDERDPALPEAHLQHSRISLIWLIPLVAVVIGGYLGWRTVMERGPLITISFQTADGIAAGQTHVRHKAVDLGTVVETRLSRDMSHVDVSVRMTAEATPYLTDQARFWVVRPRLTAGSISGLETIVSGAYIEMDPGVKKGGPEVTAFKGLEQPPTVRSDDPGRAFTLTANRLGSLGQGAPVFYRDVAVGEVLGYDFGNGAGPMHVQIFVRAPYDQFVQKGSHFWNVSGLSVQVGGSGVHVEIASLRAVLSGGVAFNTHDDPKQGTPAPADMVFPLYPDFETAANAGYTTQIPFETYFAGSVRGLTVGAPVELLGIQVGTVTGISLDFEPTAGQVLAKVTFAVQPERLGPEMKPDQEPPETIARRLVQHGLRVELGSASLLTGQLLLSLDFVEGAAPGQVRKDGDAIVLPSVGGGITSVLNAASGIAQKLDRLPLDSIGANLDATLRSAAGAMTGLQQLTRSADAQLTPALKRLPVITTALQDMLTHADRTLASVDRSYGGQSNFARELERAMLEVGDTARSIRQLADFLDRHPEALIRGRAEFGAGR